jgi:hypothetical protein
MILGEGDDDAGDVVIGAAFESEGNQFVRPFLRVAVTTGAASQVVGRYEVRQTIAGQHQTVARLRRKRMHLRRIGEIGTTEKFVEDVAIRTLPRLFGGEGTIAEQSLSDGVIDGKLFDAVAANEISATVAESRDVNAIVLPQCEDGGCAHTPTRGLMAARVKDGAIGFQQRLHHRLARIDVRIESDLHGARNNIHRHAARFFAVFLTTHAVGHQENVLRRVGNITILVIGSQPLSAAAANADLVRFHIRLPHEKKRLETR